MSPGPLVITLPAMCLGPPPLATVPHKGVGPARAPMAPAPRSQLQAVVLRNLSWAVTPMICHWTAARALSSYKVEHCPQSPMDSSNRG